MADLPSARDLTAHKQQIAAFEVRRDALTAVHAFAGQAKRIRLGPDKHALVLPIAPAGKLFGLEIVADPGIEGIEVD